MANHAIGIHNGNSAHVRQYLADIQDDAAHAAYLKDQEVLKALHEQDRLAYQELIELDPEGGEAWFDDDANIPEFGNTRERIKLVRARCAFLREQAEKSLGDMTLKDQKVWFKSVLEQPFNV